MTAGGARPFLVLAMVWIIHSFGVILILAEPSSLIDERPFLDQDWGLHHTHLVAVEAFWKLNGQLWGYNPGFMAGFPSNTHLDASIKAFELSALFTPLLSTLMAFKLWVFFATSMIPVICAVAYQNFRDSRARFGWPAVLVALLVTASWWTSLPREMYFYGMVGWPVGSAIAILVLSLQFRMLESERSFSSAHLAWLIGCAVLLPLHCQASIMLPLPGLVLLLAHAGHNKVIAWAWTVGGVGFALLVNAFWLVPLFEHFGDEYAARVVNNLPVFVSEDRLTFLKDYLTTANYWSFRDSASEKGLRLGLLAMGLAGLVRLARPHRSPSTAASAASAALGTLLAIVFLMTYFGSLHDRVQLLQPLRFKVPLDMTLALCAAFGFENWLGSSRRWRIVLSGILVLSLLAAALGIWRTEARGQMQIQVEPVAPVAALVEWLRSEASPDGRVLFEESGDETGFVYGGVFLSSFLPDWTRHQLIGGPTNLYADRHAFAEVHSGQIFGRDPRSYSDAELRRYLSLYNIGTVVSFHPVTIRRLSQLTNLVVPVRRFGRSIVVFRVDQPLDWFLEGEGRVQARLGELRVSDVRALPGSDAVVLKYHWVDGLRADPPLELESLYREDDPIPFIRVINPPQQFRLRIGRAGSAEES